MLTSSMEAATQMITTHQPPVRCTGYLPGAMATNVPRLQYDPAWS